MLAVLAESGLRLFNPLGLDWRIVAGHPVRIETLAPDFDGYFKDVRVRTNEFGHRVPTTREKRYSREKPPGAKRVLVFGDSFAFGDEWPAEDSFPEQLQQRLDPSFTRIQVLNFGVPGYNPFQEANYIRESALDFQPDAVIVQFAESNDLIPIVPPSGPPPASPLAPAKRWLRKHVELYSVLTDAWYHGRDSGLGKALWRVADQGSDAVRVSPPPPRVFAEGLAVTARQYYAARQSVIAKDEFGWRQAREAYEDIARFLGERGIPLVIVVVVANWELECRAWRCEGVTIKFAEPLGEGAPFYRLLRERLGAITPYYLSMDEALAPFTLGELYEGRGHYGPKKNALVAERLALMLERAGLRRERL